jgi:hypothetical protein
MKEHRIRLNRFKTKYKENKMAWTFVSGRNYSQWNGALGSQRMMDTMLLLHFLQ